jgi:hypothetical protein
MAAPKRPQDHKPKAEKPKAAKPQVTRTDKGFQVVHGGVSISIDAAALNDFELLRDLGRMQDVALPEARRLSMVTSVFDRFFGEEQGARVINSLRDKKTNRVTVQAASVFLFEVFGALNPES